MTPTFAVVGHPNKGKSSIVATLVEMSDIPISNIPGTTISSQCYSMRINQEVLYQLVDTPGFQRPRRVLAWLKENSFSAEDRPHTVAKFVEAHRGHPDFHDECELLQPLIDGAGILYVVDGSKPYGMEYESEMEILRWTGRPRMALINMIGDGDYVQEWRTALDQFFAIVRVFDAVRADFSKRISLLQSFAELNEEWRPALRHAVEKLQKELSQRRKKSAEVITRLLVSVLTEKLNERISVDAGTESVVTRLGEKLKSILREQEQAARKEIEYIYRYQHLTREEAVMELLDMDLFSSESVELFGLSKTQIIATGAASGAVAGVGVDVLLGGASLLMGSAIGAVIGATSALFGSERVGGMKKFGMSLANRKVSVGPVQEVNLPWVVLGRAILHHRVVSERNHARRESLMLEASSSQYIAENIPEHIRGRLNRIFTDIRKQGHAVHGDDLTLIIVKLLSVDSQTDKALLHSAING